MTPHAMRGTFSLGAAVVQRPSALALAKFVSAIAAKPVRSPSEEQLAVVVSKSAYLPR